MRFIMKLFATILFLSTPLVLSFPSTQSQATTDDISPRWQKSGQNANVHITWWGLSDCSSDPNGDTQIIYGNDTVVNMASYSLSRDLSSNEQLDFSNPTSAGALEQNADSKAFCGQYVSTASSEDKTKGCHNVPESVACFRLWAH